MHLVIILILLTCSSFCAKPDQNFFGMKQEVPPAVAELMTGLSWKEECPVPIKDLSYISVSHWDYDGYVRVGHMIVHAQLADELIEIFAELFLHRFPIERMEIVDLYGADDNRSMSANNSSCFCFRPNTTTPGVYSNHSWGIAIDINPLVNPYVRGDKVLPAGGRDYLDRTANYVGGITDSPDNACYRAFTSRGYEWGGSWPDRQDYQHFSKSPSDLLR
ncbi:MAG: M15 family metallopeptidase [Verrucomicrobia bacterium]|nr:M15 family metallopeptidase [Verrucomicrobiota bacterium]MBS0637180.1 M15 family metallopeptidase [Verrucomicrobiota bacterium]